MPSNDTAAICAYCCAPLSSQQVGRAQTFCSRACHAAHRCQQADATREDRFWGFVDRSTDCWLWQRATLTKGYGQFVIGHGRCILAHRAAWQFATDDTLTSADLIGHTCDTPACVRNDDEGWYEVRGVLLPRRGHLFKGTDLDNVRDMLDKGRMGKTGVAGERHPKAKLSEAQVIEIRARRAAGGTTLMGLAADYGVSNQLVSAIVQRLVWKHVH